MEYLTLGKIIDSFGLDGTLKVFSSTQNQKIRYKKGNKVFIYNPNTEERVEDKAVRYRSSGQIDYVKLEGINNPEDAKKLKGFELHVIKDNSDLEVGYYFYSDLIGCKVVDSSNNLLGEVSNVEEFPAQITLRVKRKGNKDFFVPFLKQFIVNVDIENKTIMINVLEGMLWKLLY